MSLRQLEILGRRDFGILEGMKLKVQVDRFVPQAQSANFTMIPDSISGPGSDPESFNLSADATLELAPDNSAALSNRSLCHFKVKRINLHCTFDFRP